MEKGNSKKMAIFFDKINSSLEEIINFKGNIQQEVMKTIRPDVTKISKESTNHTEALHDAIYRDTKKGKYEEADEAAKLLPESEQKKIKDTLIKNFVSEFISDILKGNK